MTADTNTALRRAPHKSHWMLYQTYGSHLYGMQSAASDWDRKIIYVPQERDVLLGHRLLTIRHRYDAEGNRIHDQDPVPPGGEELEFIPVQKFVFDFLEGSTYAVEMVQAFKASEAKVSGDPHLIYQTLALMSALTGMRHQHVKSMVEFASKQVYDYVHRGQRMALAEKVLWAVNTIDALHAQTDSDVRPVRLKSAWEETTVLDFLAEKYGLKIGQTENNGQPFRTLVVNDRDYVETVPLYDLVDSLTRMIKSYGKRSSEAAKEEVDWKSLAHAVRVYEQVEQYLCQGQITFPRPNAEWLRDIKLGLIPVEEVKAHLVNMENRVKALIESPKYQFFDTRSRADLQLWGERILFLFLKSFYFGKPSESKSNVFGAFRIPETSYKTVQVVERAIYVCPDRDIECGPYAANWCTGCPHWLRTLPEDDGSSALD